MSQFRCKDSAKNRFSKEKENKLSILSVRFLFQVQVPDPDPLTRSPQGGRNSFELFIYILFDLAGDLSMGMEFALKPRTTVEVYGTIRPWKETESGVNKHWAMQAQYRLWTCQKFNGFYWGPYLHAGEYNISNASLPFGLLKGLKSHRYEGWMIGGGIGCGYQYAVSKHWNVGAELGLGYTYFRSKKFDCGVCSTFHGYDNYNYWLFTKGSVYISYIF